MKQEKAEPFCLGSLLLKTTMADQSDEVLTEYVTSSTLHPHRNATENALISFLLPPEY